MCDVGQRETASSLILSFHISTVIPLDEGPALKASFSFNYLLRVLSPNTVTLDIRLQYIKFWGRGGVGEDCTIQSMASRNTFLLHFPSAFYL